MSFPSPAVSFPVKAKDAPAPVVALADAATRALATLHGSAGAAAIGPFGARQLIAERADCCGFTLARTVSAGGACRLLHTASGVVALSLARPDDWLLLPALFGGVSGPAIGDWSAVAAVAGGMAADSLVETGAVLGLAIARADLPAEPRSAPYRVLAQGPAISGGRARPPLVLDLSALWAGPLCGHLLDRMGATVIKLESRQRPDGARRGNAAFYALLNQRKRCVAIDFDDPEGRALLLRLIGRADIVIESARPRALRHIGIEPDVLVRQRPGLVWIAISGHGRSAEAEHRIGYGDDTAAAAGLSAALHRATGQWAFVEDAIADPLTGIQAARVAWEYWQAGKGALIALSLCDVVAWSLAEEPSGGEDGDRALARWYHENSMGRRRAALPPRIVEAAPGAVGADNGRVAELIARC